MSKNSVLTARVDEELRAAAMSVLREDESISTFIEQTVRDEIEWRRLNAAFQADAMLVRERIAAGQEKVIPAAEVHAELRAMLDEAKAAAADRKTARMSPRHRS